MRRAGSLICRIALALAGVYFTGCTPIVYVPGSQNVPMLESKKEARINTMLAATSNLKGPELQIAYAPLNHFGILLNGTYLWGGSEHYTGNGRQLEAALGYFSPIGDNWLIEVYGGAGQAKGEVYDYKNYPRTTERKFTTWFVQPAIGSKSERFEIAFSTKFSVIKFEKDIEFREKEINGATFLDYIFLNQPYPTRIVNYGRDFFAIEPGLTMRMGGEQVKFQVQLIHSRSDVPDNYATNLKLTGGATFYIAPRLRQPLK